MIKVLSIVLILCVVIYMAGYWALDPKSEKIRLFKQLGIALAVLSLSIGIVNTFVILF